MIAKDDCNELLNSLLPFAENMLIKHGEFFPYGSVMNLDGTIKDVAFYKGNEKPLSKDLIDDLTRIYHELARKNEIKASGIVWDGRVVSPKTKVKTDAVFISLEHKNQFSIIVVFPYKLDKNKVIWDESILMDGYNNIF